MHDESNSDHSHPQPAEVKPEIPTEDPAKEATGIVSSGQKARAADIKDALAAVHALQDAQRKQRAEADELEHSK